MGIKAYLLLRLRNHATLFTNTLPAITANILASNGVAALKQMPVVD